MIAVGLVGYKKSGKTTTSVALAHELGRRGLRVGMIKCTSHDALDKAGTDTHAMLQAAPAVAALGQKETAVFWSERRYALDLVPLLDAEVVIVEGGKNLGWLPRVLLLHEPNATEGLSPELALATFGPHTADGLPAITTIEALADLVLDKGFALPGLDCETCGRADCAGLAAEIVAGGATPGDCKALDSGMSVTVNGVAVGMNPFVKRIIGASIKGMLSELHGFAPGTVEITMKV